MGVWCRVALALYARLPAVSQHASLLGVCQDRTIFTLGWQQALRPAGCAAPHAVGAGCATGTWGEQRRHAGPAGPAALSCAGDHCAKAPVGAHGEQAAEVRGSTPLMGSAGMHGGSLAGHVDPGHDSVSCLMLSDTCLHGSQALPLEAPSGSSPILQKLAPVAWPWRNVLSSRIVTAKETESKPCFPKINGPCEAVFCVGREGIASLLCSLLALCCVMFMASQVQGQKGCC